MEQRHNIEPNGPNEDWETIMVDNPTIGSTSEVGGTGNLASAVPICHTFPPPSTFQSFQHFQQSPDLTYPSQPQQPYSSPAHDGDHSNNYDTDPNILIQQFSCMGTTDKEVLVAQLQKFVGPSLGDNAAQFFLDMNNWNLQRAIGSYFDLTDDQSLWNEGNGASNTNGSDYGPPVLKARYSMTVFESRTPHQITISPSTKISMAWKILNNGTDSWPPGTHFKLTSASMLPSGMVGFSIPEKVFFKDPYGGITVGEIRDLVIELTSPSQAGTYIMDYQLTTPEGTSIGNSINFLLIVNSDDETTMDLSRQLQNLHWNGTTVTSDSTASSTNNIEMSE